LIKKSLNIDKVKTKLENDILFKKDNFSLRKESLDILDDNNANKVIGIMKDMLNSFIKKEGRKIEGEIDCKRIDAYSVMCHITINRSMKPMYKTIRIGLYGRNFKYTTVFVEIKHPDEQEKFDNIMTVLLEIGIDGKEVTAKMEFLVWEGISFSNSLLTKHTQFPILSSSQNKI